MLLLIPYIMQYNKKTQKRKRNIHEYMILEVTYFISSRKRSLRVFHGPTESTFHSFLFCSLAQLATKMELDNNKIFKDDGKDMQCNL